MPPTGTRMRAFDWMKDAIDRHHWVHYCWIQFARRSWVEAHHFRFPPRNVFHQDIFWTADLAAENPIMVFFARYLRRVPRLERVDEQFEEAPRR